MTALPSPNKKKLGLVIDLDTCVGCHACAVACKEWNDGGQFGPLPDSDPYGADPIGVWLNRVHTYEIAPHPNPPPRAGEGDERAARAGRDGQSNTPQMVHFP